MPDVVIYPHLAKRLRERGIALDAVRMVVAAGTRERVGAGGRECYQVDEHVAARYPSMRRLLGLCVVVNECRAVVTAFWGDAARRAS